MSSNGIVAGRLYGNDSDLYPVAIQHTMATPTQSSPETYDINFCYPLPKSNTLETPRIKLTPFLPKVHAAPFIAACQGHPDLTRYLPLTFPTLEIFLKFVEDWIRSDVGCILFAVLDKTKLSDAAGNGSGPEAEAYALAGIIGLVHTSPFSRTTEIGPVTILPQYQRTHVSSNAIGAVLKYCLDGPKLGGLGLRRVAWTAHPNNERSVKTAERMGMRKEGVLRWTWILEEGREGNGREVDMEERARVLGGIVCFWLFVGMIGRLGGGRRSIS
ncbi:acyl-CoA N-acyltransferase [Infundibulicybe gibba]|nr:acyl-CoA N-acyltransferase [Infundibulicybe gibba]